MEYLPVAFHGLVPGLAQYEDGRNVTVSVRLFASRAFDIIRSPFPLSFTPTFLSLSLSLSLSIPRILLIVPFHFFFLSFSIPVIEAGFSVFSLSFYQCLFDCLLVDTITLSALRSVRIALFLS